MFSWPRCVAATGVVAFIVLATGRALAGDAITAEQAVALALERSPRLLARTAEVEQARGRLSTAEAFPHDPEISVEGARRSSPDDTVTDHEIALSQEIEIGGQRGRRTAQASAEVEAARARLGREEQLLVARVKSAFTEAIRTREMLEVERANRALAQSLAEVARKRFEAGAIAQVEVNLAQVQLGRAEREMDRAEGAYAVARAVLAEAIGLDASDPPEPAGRLEPPAPVVEPLEALLARGEGRRADLLSLRHAGEAARARIDLARRERVPNLTLAVFSAREDGSDDIAGGSIGLSLPLFDRKRGEVAESLALERQLLAETRTVELTMRQEIGATLARYRTAASAAETLRERVIGTLRENLTLLQRSFEAGKTGWTDVLVYRREFVDVQRDYIDTVTEAHLAAIELELATGSIALVTQEETGP